MSKSRKSTAAEAKLKKKEYDRKRREKLKNCPESLEKLREKERLKYLKKKEKGQVKSVSAMSSRERRQKQKQWRLNSSKYREKNQNVRKNLERLMNETPPACPVSPAKPSSRVNAVKNETVALRRRRQLRNRRAILYGRIAKLEKNLKEGVRKSEKYKKKYTRLNDRINTSSPEAKVKTLIKNTRIFSNDVLEFRTLSCFDCVGKCQHFHLGYYKTFEVSDKDTPAVSTRRKRKEAKVESNVKVSKITPYEKNAYGYKVGDHVLITWNNEVYPGKILSLSDDGALVRCMKKGSKCWKWPTVKDEELYAWADVLQIIKPPKLLSRGCYFVKEVDERK